MASDTSDRQQKIRDGLVPDKDQKLEENIDRAENLIYLMENGSVKIKANRDELSTSEEALLYSIGAWFSFEAGFREENTFDTSEVISNTTISSKKSASARLSDLKKEGMLDSPSRGAFKLHDAMVGEALSKIEDSLESEE